MIYIEKRAYVSVLLGRVSQTEESAVINTQVKKQNAARGHLSPGWLLLVPSFHVHTEPFSREVESPLPFNLGWL